MFGEEEVVKSHHQRAQIIANLIILSFAIILARLWYLQIYKGELLYQYSLKNRLRKEIVRAPRGKIYTRNNQLIVDNVPRFDAVLTPQYLKNKTKILKRMSVILDMPINKIESVIRKNSRLARYKPIILKKNISQKEVALIETENNDLPGISVDTFISRRYFDKSVGAHLFGYISEISKSQLPKFRKRDDFDYYLGDFIGQFGLEEQLDQTIRGKNGFEFVEVDAFGRKKRNINNKIFKDVKNIPSTPGKSVRLTLDRDLQLSAFKALKNKVGSAVAIDVNTGEILAMVSRPSFDPSQFSRGLSVDYWRSLVGNPDKPLRDRTIQEHYSPGSTFKLVTAIAALEEGLINKDTEINCSGFIKVGRRKYHCWKKHGHGKVNLKRALRESCNIYFLKIATKLDIDSLANYARKFGFGQKTGIGLPRENSGLMPTRAWKKKKFGVKWQLGETLSCSIGQSFVLSTPLQLASAYAALANNGKLLRPYILKDIIDRSGKSISQNKKQILSETNIKLTTLEAIKEGFYEVVNHPKGTAWWSRGRGIQMAGKTGTSQVVRATADTLYQKCEQQKYKFRHHGVFVGFAPYSSPKIAVAVLIEHGCHGSSSAAPVAEAIISTYMKKYYPDIFEENLKIDKEIRRKWFQKKKQKSVVSL